MKKEVISRAPMKRSTPKEYYRMSIVIDPELHSAFKAATAAQGKQMSEVIVEFIRNYVKTHAPAARPAQKGGRA